VCRDGKLLGVKAKTHYPNRPDEWPEGKDWPADVALSLVQADLLRGKWVGFLPTKVHQPKMKEFEDRQWSDKVDLVIDERLLFEYAGIFLPPQQNAVVKAVSKSQVVLSDDFIKAMGLNTLLFESKSKLDTQAAREAATYKLSDENGEIK